MNARRKFADEILEGLSKSKVLRIRAGAGQHRFIGIWVVVVEDRVFVRSWSVKPDGWYSTFLQEANGAILDKYSGKGSLQYAKDLGSAKSRATTLELVPLAKTRS